MLLVSALLLAGFFYFIHRLKRQEYLLAWSAAWLLMSLHFAAGALSALIGRDPWDRWFLELSEFLIALSALAFYAAARSYAGLKVPVALRLRSRPWFSPRGLRFT